MENPKIEIIKYLDKTVELMDNVKLMNFDFRKFIKMLAFRPDSNEKDDSFIYNDPPYLETNDNYSNSFTELDSFDLFEANQKTGCKWAMSEFDHPFILDQAKERGLNVLIIGERQNLKNRRIEILITNYENTQYKLFD